MDIIAASKADIIAEMTYTDIKTGEPATSHIRKALETGKHVVTSNKGPAALHYAELKALADRKKLHFRIEGTVMSGTPVFTLCERGFAGNTIKEIQGILNGTTNFILTKMELENMDYADALALAQKLGYAEADPTADVGGFDALAKVVILSNVLLGGKLKPSAITARRASPGSARTWSWPPRPRASATSWSASPAAKAARSWPASRRASSPSPTP